MAMSEFKTPGPKKDLKAFFGSIRYCQRFIEHFANSAALLTHTSTAENVVWDDDMACAFCALCTYLFMYANSLF